MYRRVKRGCAQPERQHFSRLGDLLPARHRPADAEHGSGRLDRRAD